MHKWKYLEVAAVILTWNSNVWCSRNRADSWGDGYSDVSVSTTYYSGDEYTCCMYSSNIQKIAKLPRKWTLTILFKCRRWSEQLVSQYNNQIHFRIVPFNRGTSSAEDRSMRETFLRKQLDPLEYSRQFNLESTSKNNERNTKNPIEMIRRHRQE